MGPDGKDTAQAAVYIDGQPVQYAGEITLPEQVERPAPPLLSSMGLTVTKIWGAIQAAEEFRKALRWAEAVNRPLAARYHRTKKKRIRKKYAKRILAWYREEIL